MSHSSDNQTSGSRRSALRKLGLGLGAVYAAPALLMLSGCHAHAGRYPHHGGHGHGSYPSHSRPSYSRPSRGSYPSRY